MDGGGHKKGYTPTFSVGKIPPGFTCRDESMDK